MGSNDIEFSTMETNTENFIELFTSISNYQGDITIDFAGEKRNRSKILSAEVIKDIKSIMHLYSELNVNED